METPDGGHGGRRGLAVAALALVGLLFSLTPIAERIDGALLDAQWASLARFAPRPAADDIIVVGLDEPAYQAIAEPRALWHEPLGRALVRIASARPRAIGLDLALPERSFDAVRAGLDRTLMVALATARERAPVVAALSIDVRTRAARPIHGPFIAVLRDEGLGIGMHARDVDGVVRRFSLALPTEDGSFATFPGRLCRAVASACGEGLVHYALGRPIAYVSLRKVLQTQDTEWLDRMFRDRIVLLGETQRFVDRVPVPVRVAAWEPSGQEDAPGVAAHAQALRTAMLDASPREAARPLVALLVLAAATLFWMRDWRLAGVTVLVGALALFVGGAALLHGGVYVPLGAAVATLAAAWAARAMVAARGRA